MKVQRKRTNEARKKVVFRAKSGKVLRFIAKKGGSK